MSVHIALSRLDIAHSLEAALVKRRVSQLKVA